MGHWRAVIDLPATVGAPATARHLLTELLTAWELPELVDDGAVLVSEIVTNAYQHAAGADSFELELIGRADGVEISMADGSSIHPMIRHLASEASDGRGMRIVELLATEWGSEGHAGGKRVWIRLDRQPPPA